MEKAKIEERVIAILSKKMEVDQAKITGQTRLAEDLGVDSFGAVELMFEVEEAFSIKLPESDIDHVRTVNDIVGYIIKYTRATPPLK